VKWGSDQTLERGRHDFASGSVANQIETVDGKGQSGRMRDEMSTGLRSHRMRGTELREEGQGQIEKREERKRAICLSFLQSTERDISSLK